MAAARVAVAGSAISWLLRRPARNRCSRRSSRHRARRTRPAFWRSGHRGSRPHHQREADGPPSRSTRTSQRYRQRPRR